MVKQPATIPMSQIPLTFAQNSADCESTPNHACIIAMMSNTALRATAPE
jgi:hypothetical protein